jgi:hypothetical protein
MSSNQDSTPGAARDTAQHTDMSTPASPTDSRHPLSRVESIAQQITPQNEALSESYQSTDTVRRRPEPQSYGMSHPLSLTAYQQSLYSKTDLVAKAPSYRPRRIRPNIGTASPHRPATDQYRIAWSHPDRFNHYGRPCWGLSEDEEVHGRKNLECLAELLQMCRHLTVDKSSL